jgi:hypothetical protein
VFLILKTRCDHDGFVVLTAVAVKSSVFCDIMPCGPVTQSTFRRKIWTPGLKSKPRKKPA